MAAYTKVRIKSRCLYVFFFFNPIKGVGTQLKESAHKRRHGIPKVRFQDSQVRVVTLYNSGKEPFLDFFTMVQAFIRGLATCK